MCVLSGANWCTPIAEIPAPRSEFDLGEGYTLFEDAYIVRGLVFPSLAGGSRVLVRGEEPILMSADTANGVISYQGTACKKQA